jgi:DMSO/TMAO reductase YedYZ heme-binding membrane subunit
VVVVIEIAGLAAWYLLVAQVLLGTIYAAGMGRLLIAPRLKLRLHRWMTVALLAAVVLHVAAVLIKHFHDWTLAQALEVGPGSFAHNCGALALWLLVLVAASRVRLFGIGFSPAARRQLHRLSYLVLVFGTVHALLAGPDAGSLAIAGPGIACLSALAAALLGRYHKSLAKSRARTRTTARHLQRAT